MSPFQRSRAVPHPSYEVTNLTGNIGRLRERVARGARILSFRAHAHRRVRDECPQLRRERRIVPLLVLAIIGRPRADQSRVRRCSVSSLNESAGRCELRSCLHARSGNRLSGGPRLRPPRPA